MLPASVASVTGSTDLPDDAPSVGLDDVHRAENPAESGRLYAAWAPKYDAEFRPGYRYVYNDEVVGQFVSAVPEGVGPIIDVGCGTGAVGESLAALGTWTLDGIDLSSEMLALAGAKTDADGRPLYRHLLQGDLTSPTPVVAPGTYDAAVSSGLFTHGHVGPEVLGAVAAMVRPGGLLCLGVNGEFFEVAKFDDALRQLEADGIIRDMSLSEIRIYAEDANHEHVDTMAQVVLAFAG